jgi:uncharacterized membrane protein
LTARIRKLLSDLSDTFWLLPGLMVVAGVIGAVVLVQLDRDAIIPQWMLDGAWLYNGGATGARTLLGAIASSTIAVAGTVFSITIAALSLAAGQMGPRLLRNFTRDRGNQFTLGAFLGTFAFALMVLRSVRTESEGEFIPHLSLSVAIVLAFLCVGTLVWFVGHMAGRINVDTVIDLVSVDVHEAIERLTTEDELPAPPPSSFWSQAQPVPDYRYGYLQQLDEEGLADWAAANDTAVRLLVRPGHYVFPGAPIALVNPTSENAEEAVLQATALGHMRVSPADVEFAVRHLVEVAVRALSPGVNDPRTAISVLDRLGTALCQIVPRRLPSGVWLRDGKPVLVVPNVDYEGLVAAMFHMIRQNAATQPAVLIRMLEVLTAVVSCERDPDRVAILQRHADLILADAERGKLAPSDMEDVRDRHQGFAAMREGGPLAVVSG